MHDLRTQVGIVGAGPAGLLLGHLLHRQGVDTVVLEQRSRAYVEQRVRAGVLEHGTARLLEECGVGARMGREGLVHHGIELRFERARHRVPLSELADGRAITVYGQQEVVKDLIAARLEAGAPLHFEADVVGLEGFEGEASGAAGGGRPTVHFRLDGRDRTLECDLVAGCDGFHGVSRAAMPTGLVRAYERVLPYAWLGILAAAAPATEELIYCRSDRGFALYSMRSPELSRLYLQVSPQEDLSRWPDDRIWDELDRRLEVDEPWELERGRVLERSLTAMRSFVVEPMQHGALFLAGDAGHIVPPTGAKGMNLAMADVRDLASAMAEWFSSGDRTALARYSAGCLERAWRAQEFSMFMTTMLHPLADDPFDGRTQEARLRYLVCSETASRSLAERYVDLSGLPAGAAPIVTAP